MTDIKTGADVRAKLDHPVIDCDGHMMECSFAILDFIKQIGGVEIAERYEKILKDHEIARTRRAVWVSHSGRNTLDGATAMLPKLMRERLDEAGIDFAVIYGTHALGLLTQNDDELRPILFRAMNMLYADMFDEVADRLTPVALIPAHSPQEALSELNYAVGELGMKAVVINTMVRRPAEQILSEAPHLAKYSSILTSPAMDTTEDFDPVWARCVELGVAISCHNAFRGPGSSHASTTNYVFNSLGSFGQGSDYFCRSLIFGGVPRRFPQLKFAFLEGGVSWASALYNGLFEYWDKRNLDALRETLDPAKQDVDLLVDMFEKYGNEYLTPERIRAEPYHEINSYLDVPPEEVNDFAPAGIEKPDDIRDLFASSFYFGCEADDRLNALAFDTRLNHCGLKLNAILGSDIGHWDVPDMTKVMVEAYEMVEDELMTEDDFRAFTYGNAVDLYASLNKDFFKDTAVEDAVAAELAKKA